MRRVPIALVLGATLVACAHAVDDGPADPPSGARDAPGAPDARSMVAPSVGEAWLRGSLGVDAHDTDDARAIARRAPQLQIVVALGPATCTRFVGVTHVTIDLGASVAATYEIVPGYPAVEKLRPTEARVRLCPANASTSTGRECDRTTQSGTLVITHADAADPGRVEGWFSARFASGTLEGAFSAPRCS